MKKLISLLLVLSFCSVIAQTRRAPVMAPVLADGYYINKRGDTISGQVQVNPADKTDFYSKFLFKTKRSRRPRAMNARMAKAYGFNGHNFVLVTYKGKNMFVERLATGRLQFYEYRYHGSVDGYPAITSYYFIKDTQAGGDDVELAELRKISGKFYKRSLRPYMKDHVDIWERLDKYTFERRHVIKAVREFNAQDAMASVQ